MMTFLTPGTATDGQIAEAERRFKQAHGQVEEKAREAVSLGERLLATPALPDAEQSSDLLVIPLRDLPAGSLVTITIRVGAEQAPPADDAPVPTPKRYMGQRING